MNPRFDQRVDERQYFAAVGARVERPAVRDQRIIMTLHERERVFGISKRPMFQSFERSKQLVTVANSEHVTRSICGQQLSVVASLAAQAPFAIDRYVHHTMNLSAASMVAAPFVDPEHSMAIGTQGLLHLRHGLVGHGERLADLHARLTSEYGDRPRLLMVTVQADVMPNGPSGCRSSRGFLPHAIFHQPDYAFRQFDGTKHESSCAPCEQ